MAVAGLLTSGAAKFWHTICERNARAPHAVGPSQNSCAGDFYFRTLKRVHAVRRGHRLGCRTVVWCGTSRVFPGAYVNLVPFGLVDAENLPERVPAVHQSAVFARVDMERVLCSFCVNCGRVEARDLMADEEVPTGLGRAGSRTQT